VSVSTLPEQWVVGWSAPAVAALTAWTGANFSLCLGKVSEYLGPEWRGAVPQAVLADPTLRWELDLRELPKVRELELETVEQIVWRLRNLPPTRLRQIPGAAGVSLVGAKDTALTAVSYALALGGVPSVTYEFHGMLYTVSPCAACQITAPAPCRGPAAGSGRSRRRRAPAPQVSGARTATADYW
jgi:hypothetical protein